MLVEIEASIDGTSSYNILFDESKAKHSTCPTHRKSSVKVPKTNFYIRAQDLKLTDENLDICKSKHALVSVDGSGLLAVMSELVTIGLREATDESNRWCAINSTDKILTKREKSLKNGVELNEGAMGSWRNSASGRDVLVWSSKCTRSGYGSEYPVVKARGLIPASASEVIDLLRDSSQVRKYNKMSIGRVDQFVLTQQGTASLHSFRKCPLLGVSGEVKIMSSKSQPPLVRKPLEFKTLFYARRLEKSDNVEFDRVAYITVGRSVWETPDGTTGGTDSSTTRCEILLSVNLLREVTTDSGKQYCELTSITHAVSPGVPMFLGKQMGLMAAENYIKDIRALFEKKP